MPNWLEKSPGFFPSPAYVRAGMRVFLWILILLGVLYILLPGTLVSGYWDDLAAVLVILAALAALGFDVLDWVPALRRCRMRRAGCGPAVEKKGGAGDD